jgi:preprotein translocase subunit SecE
MPSTPNFKTMKIIEYVKETKAEMAHVTWPTRKQAIAYSVLVVVVSVAISVFLGVFDYIFSKLLTLLF